MQPKLRSSGLRQRQHKGSPGSVSGEGNLQLRLDARGAEKEALSLNTSKPCEFLFYAPVLPTQGVK